MVLCTVSGLDGNCFVLLFVDDIPLSVKINKISVNTFYRLNLAAI